VTFDELIRAVGHRAHQFNKSGSLFTIELVVQPGHTLEDAHKAVDGVLADLKKNPPTKAELQRALNSEETGTFYAMEILGGFSGRAERLQTLQPLSRRPGKLGWDLDRYKKVTTKDLERVFNKYLTTNGSWSTRRRRARRAER